MGLRHTRAPSCSNIERFTGEFADEANKLIDEDYREEFKLPVVA